MLRSLSAWLRTTAENGHDGRIPAAELTFIRNVQSAEQQMRREQHPVDVAMAELTDAFMDVARHAALARRPGAEPEDKARAEADLIAATHLLDDLARGLRLAARPLSLEGGRAA